MESIRLKGRGWLSALLVLVWACLLFRFLLAPQWHEYQRVSSDLALARARLASYKITAASVEEEEERLAEVRKLLEGEGKSFSTEVQDGGAVTLLGLGVAAEGLEINALEPGKARVDRNIRELPFKVIVSGDYLRLINFLNRLENGLVLADLTEIRSLKVTSLNNGGTGSEGGRVKAVLGMVIYSSTRPGEQVVADRLGWLRGRFNAFQTPGLVAPVPELEGKLKDAGASETEGIVRAGGSGRTGDAGETVRSGTLSGISSGTPEGMVLGNDGAF